MKKRKCIITFLLNKKKNFKTFNIKTTFHIQNRNTIVQYLNLIHVFGALLD